MNLDQSSRHFEFMTTFTAEVTWCGALVERLDVGSEDSVSEIGRSGIFGLSNLTRSVLRNFLFPPPVTFGRLAANFLTRFRSPGPLSLKDNT